MQLTFVDNWLVKVWTLSCASLKSLLRRLTSCACFSSAPIPLYNDDDPVDIKLNADP